MPFAMIMANKAKRCIDTVCCLLYYSVARGAFNSRVTFDIEGIHQHQQPTNNERKQLEVVGGWLDSYDLFVLIL